MCARIIFDLHQASCCFENKIALVKIEVISILPYSRPTPQKEKNTWQRQTSLVCVELPGVFRCQNFKMTDYQKRVLRYNVIFVNQNLVFQRYLQTKAGQTRLVDLVQTTSHDSNKINLFMFFLCEIRHTSDT